MHVRPWIALALRPAVSADRGSILLVTAAVTLLAAAMVAYMFQIGP